MHVASMRTSGSDFVMDANPRRNWTSRALASWKSQCWRHTACRAWRDRVGVKEFREVV